MKNIVYSLLIVSFLFLTAGTKAQQINEDQTPALVIKGESENQTQVRLDDIKIEVSVIGNLATTTYEMSFYNSEDRILEGELVFPLGDGITVSRFAMDVNGKLREAVPVEKEKGQQVFETIERRRVDPGLLEVVQGNTFRTRVYPIPANGYKKIVIAYQEELKTVQGKPVYMLPLYFNQKVGSFAIKVEVLKQMNPPVILSGDLKNFKFEHWNEKFIAQAHYKDVSLNTQLKFALPVSSDLVNVFVEKGIKSGETYFYFNLPVKNQLRDKKLPSKLAIFWDVSSSGSQRNIENELELLKQYLSKIGNVKIELFLFANTIEEPLKFNISNGNTASLLRRLKNLDYDGGTQLSLLNFDNVEADEILLFSDGMGTFGKQDFNVSANPVIVINSSPSAEISLLNNLAIVTGGKYINLLITDVDKALESLLSQTLQFISAEYDNKNISEIYPSNQVQINESFSLAGIIKSKGGTIKLNFGYGNKVTFSQTVDLNTDVKNYNGLIEKIWAQFKLRELDLLFDKNKNDIALLGKKYSIVTRNTSLIVLETAADYAQYEIEPPAELLDEYLTIVKQKRNEFSASERNTLDRVVSMYKDKIMWWNTKYPLEVAQPVKIAEPERIIERNTERNWFRLRHNRTGNRNNIEPVYRNYDNNSEENGSVIPARQYSSVLKTVTGNVYDINDGSPLPGVCILLEGTTQGVISDLNGAFTLSIPENGILKFSYVGYITESMDMSDKNNITIGMAPDIRSLEEVVIVGYGTAKRSIFGSRSNSVISESVNRGNEAQPDFSNGEGAIFIKPWIPDAPYMESLKDCEECDLYKKYLELKVDFGDMPSFYVDVSSYLWEKGLSNQAIRILSNLAEMQLLNHELLRVLAHKLEQMQLLSESIEVYKKIIEIRKEEPQSYRDLALVYSKNGQYQEAVDILYEAVKKSWANRFPGIETIMVTEMNSIIALSNNKVDVSDIDNRLLNNLPVDIRIVLNWDADNTDMDLWVTDPNGEKCFYSHKRTIIGGIISNDFTGGYGPEEFMLKNAVKGKYLVEANYYGSNQQRIAGPVTIYLQLYTNYGKVNQTCEEITLRLSTNSEIAKIGVLEF